MAVTSSLNNNLGQQHYHRTKPHEETQGQEALLPSSAPESGVFAAQAKTTPASPRNVEQHSQSAITTAAIMSMITPPPRSDEMTSLMGEVETLSGQINKITDCHLTYSQGPKKGAAQIEKWDSEILHKDMNDLENGCEELKTKLKRLEKIGFPNPNRNREVSLYHSCKSSINKGTEDATRIGKILQKRGVRS